MAEPNPVIEQIRTLTGNAVQSNASVAASKTRAADEITNLISFQQDTLRDSATAKQIKNSAERSAQMAAQDQAIQIISGARGVETLGRLLGETTKIADEVVGLTQVVKKEQTTRLVDDPIGWIKAQLDWDNNAKKLQETAGQLQLTQATAASVASQIGQVGEKSKALARTITNIGIQAENDEIRLLADGQAANLAIAGIKENLVGVEAAANADDRTLALATNLYQVDRNERQFQLGLEAAAQSREKFKLEKQEKEDEKAFEGRVIQSINAAEKLDGRIPSTAQEVRDVIKLNKGLSAEYADLYTRGRIALSSGQALLGFSPAEAAANLNRNPDAIQQLPPQQRKVAEILTRAQDALLISKLDAKTKAELDGDKTGKVRARILNELAIKDLAQQSAFVGNNQDNVFHIGSPQPYFAAPAFDSYKLTELVFKPAFASNVQLTDPQVAFDQTLLQVKKGQITGEQAAKEFSSIYTRMSAMHKQQADFRKFAFTLPASTSQYKVNISGEVVDLTNFQAVALLMARRMRETAMSDYRRGIRVNPGLEKELRRNTQGFPDE